MLSSLILPSLTPRAQFEQAVGHAFNDPLSNLVFLGASLSRRQTLQSLRDESYPGHIRRGALDPFSTKERITDALIHQPAVPSWGSKISRERLGGTHSSAAPQKESTTTVFRTRRASIEANRSAPPMPQTVFDSKGIPAHRRERIEAAVTAGGKHVRELYEGWIATEPFRGDVRVIITGPHGFERRAGFSLDEDPAEITRRVRETIR